MAGGQDEQDERQELRERHEAKVERIAADAEHLPSDRNGLDLGCDAHQESGRQVAAQVGMTQDGELVVRRVARHGPRSVAAARRCRIPTAGSLR